MAGVLGKYTFLCQSTGYLKCFSWLYKLAVKLTQI